MNMNSLIDRSFDREYVIDQQNTSRSYVYM